MKDVIYRRNSQNNRSVEEVLYPAMEDYCIDIVIGKGPSARSIRLDLTKFNRRTIDKYAKSIKIDLSYL